jgi:hypothetical protein
MFTTALGGSGEICPEPDKDMQDHYDTGKPEADKCCIKQVVRAWKLSQHDRKDYTEQSCCTQQGRNFGGRHDFPPAASFLIFAPLGLRSFHLTTIAAD